MTPNERSDSAVYQTAYVGKPRSGRGDPGFLLIKYCFYYKHYHN